MAGGKWSWPLHLCSWAAGLCCLGPQFKQLRRESVKTSLLLSTRFLLRDEDANVLRVFFEALSESSDPKKADQAWTDVIELDPSNSYAGSNRGTIRLQQV